MKKYKTRAHAILSKQKDQIAEQTAQIEKLLPIKNELEILQKKYSELDQQNLHTRTNELEEKLQSKISELQTMNVELNETKRKLNKIERDIVILREENENDIRELKEEHEQCIIYIYIFNLNEMLTI